VAKDKKKKDRKSSKKSGGTLKALAQNPLVADVVAAALVATASALKDSKRARALASEASDELAKLSKSGAKTGEALWDMALQIGRRSLEALKTEDKAPKPAKPKTRPKSKPATRKKSKKKASAGAASR
jgi:hypothetical protein